MLRMLAAVAAVALAGSVPASAGEVPDFTCGIAEELLVGHSPLPRTAAALQRNGRLTILAIGSLSTAGAGTSPATSWPSRLRDDLAQRYPTATIHVVNRGRAHQRAGDMLAKLDADVLEAKPDLVIWESGTLDAIDNTDPGQYADILLAGIDRLMAANIDVVLMDSQFSRRSTAVIDFEPYVEAIERVAEMRDLVVFPRFRIMRYWVDQGLVSYRNLTPPRQVQLADGIYACIAGGLARMVADGISAATPVSAAKPGGN